jgi:molecular chaperone GrpE
MAGEENKNEAKKQGKQEQADEAKVNSEKKEGADAKESAPEKNEVEELKDRLLRLAAEFDNYKKRSAREISEAKKLGKAELLKKLLPALDELSLAIELSGANKDEDPKIKGIELVYSNMMSSLKSEGLEEIDANGKYDPYKHEIIMTRESSENDGSIIEVIRNGYTLDNILIRPASVIVSKKAHHAEEKENQEKENQEKKDKEYK